MGYITGNQDRVRFISYASGDVSFEEDGKLAGWTREITISDSSAFDRLEMLVAFTSTIPGIPVIYYGDEIGSPGANDPDNRRMMKFSYLDKREAELKSNVSHLFKIRKQYPTLIYGDTQFLLEKEDQWAFLRTWFGENALVIFNKSAKDSNVTIELPIVIDKKAELLIDNGSNLIIKDKHIEVELPPLSYQIILYRS